MPNWKVFFFFISRSDFKFASTFRLVHSLEGCQGPSTGEISFQMTIITIIIIIIVFLLVIIWIHVILVFTSSENEITQTFNFLGMDFCDDSGLCSVRQDSSKYVQHMIVLGMMRTTLHQYHPKVRNLPMPSSCKLCFCHWSKRPGDPGIKEKAKEPKIDVTFIIILTLALVLNTIQILFLSGGSLKGSSVASVRHLLQEEERGMVHTAHGCGFYQVLFYHDIQNYSDHDHDAHDAW